MLIFLRGSIVKKYLFGLMFFVSHFVFATTTGIAGVDEEVTLGTKILQVFLVVVGLGCIAYASYMFGSGKAKSQGLEIIFGLLAMAGIAIGGTAWWVGKTSGFII